jgi:hypothetical protein
MGAAAATQRGQNSEEGDFLDFQPLQSEVSQSHTFVPYFASGIQQTA